MLPGCVRFEDRVGNTGRKSEQRTAIPGNTRDGKEQQTLV